MGNIPVVAMLCGPPSIFKEVFARLSEDSLW